MRTWRDRRVLDLFGIELPIVQAPMAGANGAGMVVAVSEAGGLGSLPCAMLDAGRVRAEVAEIRRGTSKPFNLNFFCHARPVADAEREAAWRKRLERYYQELGIEAGAAVAGARRAPFDEAMCAVVEEVRPAVVSFHFGMPDGELVKRVKASGAKVISSATTVAEALWLEAEGCDAVVAQGFEAGGHQGMFLSADIATRVGTMALVPQVVDAVKVPVIAAGGIGDARGVAAALTLGASAVQLGTAYLFCPEATISTMHRNALAGARDDSTALTNVFTGRPARGIVNRLVREVGPVSAVAPAFPGTAGAVAPLRAKAEAAGSAEFSPLWAGQAAGLGKNMGAGALTSLLAEEAGRLLG